MTADGRQEVRSCEVAFMTEYDAEDVVGELFDVFPDVEEKGITVPVSYHHGGEGGNSCEINDHGAYGSDGAGADIGRFEAQSILAYKLCGGVKLGADDGEGDGLEVAVDEDGVDGGFFIFSWVGGYLVDYCYLRPDQENKVVSRPVHCR